MRFLTGRSFSKIVRSKKIVGSEENNIFKKFVRKIANLIKIKFLKSSDQFQIVRFFFVFNDTIVNVNFYSFSKMFFVPELYPSLQEDRQVAVCTEQRSLMKLKS